MFNNVAKFNFVGRVKVGTSYLYGFREDKRNIVKVRKINR